jgi:hypothetical protein
VSVSPGTPDLPSGLFTPRARMSGKVSLLQDKLRCVLKKGFQIVSLRSVKKPRVLF